MAIEIMSEFSHQKNGDFLWQTVRLPEGKSRKPPLNQHFPMVNMDHGSHPSWLPLPTPPRPPVTSVTVLGSHPVRHAQRMQMHHSKEKNDESLRLEWTSMDLYSLDDT